MVLSFLSRGSSNGHHCWTHDAVVQQVAWLMFLNNGVFRLIAGLYFSDSFMPSGIERLTHTAHLPDSEL
jgi:hypothetical protein